MFGGPGSGKSTTASGLFSLMKCIGMSTEIVHEYAKDLTWHGDDFSLSAQDHVFSTQHMRIRRLVGKVDYVITDSPLLLSAVYAKPDDFQKSLKAVISETFNHYDNINFFIARVKPYVKEGRSQDERQAAVKDNEISALINAEQIDYTIVNGDDNAAQTIFDTITKKVF